MMGHRILSAIIQSGNLDVKEQTKNIIHLGGHGVKAQNQEY